MIVAVLYACTSPNYIAIDAGSPVDESNESDGSASEPDTDGESTQPIDAADPVDSAIPVRVDASRVIGPKPDTSVDSAQDSGTIDSSMAAEVSVAREASSEVDATQPSDVDLSWADELIGSYAVRFDSFAVDGDVVIENLEYSFAKFIAVDEQVVLRIETCSLTSEWRLLGVVDQSSRVVRPDSFPIRELVVEKSDNSWETLSQPPAIGYFADPLDGCSPGESMPASQQQRVWLNSADCRCYSSNAIPQYTDDCRLLDSDGDGNPGVTLEVRGAINNDFYVATNRSDRLVQGSFDPAGFHIAHELKDSSIELLGCEDTNAMLCTMGNAVSCRSDVNWLRFARLNPSTPEGGEWNCQAVTNHKDELLPTEAPDFTAGDC